VRWRMFRCSGKKRLSVSARIPNIGARSGVEITHAGQPPIRRTRRNST
jgi:hypothetical protein